MVRDTADQIWLRHSIPGTKMAIRITGKNREIIANTCVPGPAIGRLLQLWTQFSAKRATGTQTIPANRTAGTGANNNSQGAFVSTIALTQ